MSTELQKLTYLVRCYNYCNDLIRSFAWQRPMTLPQAARLERWKRVRRALAWDIERARAALPDGTRLMLVCSSEQENAAMEWQIEQLRAFAREGYSNTQRESVAPSATLSERVSD